MILTEINKIECNLHCLLTLDEAYKRIVDDLQDYFSVRKINFLIVIHGYNRGIYFQESVRSDRFIRKMEKLGYKIIRYEKLEKKEGVHDFNEGITAYYIDDLKNPSRKSFLPNNKKDVIEVEPKLEIKFSSKKENTLKKKEVQILKDPIETKLVETNIIKNPTPISSENTINAQNSVANQPSSTIFRHENKIEHPIFEKQTEIPMHIEQNTENKKNVCGETAENQSIHQLLQQFSALFEKMNENLSLQNQILTQMIKRDENSQKFQTELLNNIKNILQYEHDVRLENNATKNTESQKRQTNQTITSAPLVPNNQLAKSFICEICGEFFPTQDLRIKHAIQKKHKVKGPIECQICKKKFKSQLDFDQHCLSLKH